MIGKALITGGAGFMGSHLAERLVEEGVAVKVYDNLTTGSVGNIEHHLDKPNFNLVVGDLLDEESVFKALLECDIVYHLAANPEVRIGSTDTQIDFEQNLVATRNLLEAMRRSTHAKTIVFASTSTVYGEAERIPTAEDYAPLIPISLYGASKLGCEALIAAYCHLFGMRSVIYRFANVVGPRSRHGVLHDFLLKLTRNPKELEILGDGTQSKSYLHIDDCIEAFLFGVKYAGVKPLEIFNVGTDDKVNVKTIAQIVVEEMGLEDVKLYFTGGINGRGWMGDVKVMLLDVGKLRKLGWRPRYSSVEAVRLAVRSMLKEAQTIRRV